VHLDARGVLSGGRLEARSHEGLRALTARGFETRARDDMQHVTIVLEP